jgi:hypothetical protein
MFRIWAGNEMHEFCNDGVDRGVMPCLTIQDRNGRFIYEKDIVQISGSDTIIPITNYAEFLLYCGEYKGKNGVDLPPLLTVIGNLYDEVNNEDSKTS